MVNNLNKFREILKSSQEQDDDINEKKVELKNLIVSSKYFVKIIFDKISLDRGDHWKLSPSELDILSQQIDEALDRHLPSIILNPDIVLLMTISTIILPRLVKDLESNSKGGG